MAIDINACWSCASMLISVSAFNPQIDMSLISGSAWTLTSNTAPSLWMQSLTYWLAHRFDIWYGSEGGVWLPEVMMASCILWHLMQLNCQRAFQSRSSNVSSWMIHWYVFADLPMIWDVIAWIVGGCGPWYNSGSRLMQWVSSIQEVGTKTKIIHGMIWFLSWLAWSGTEFVDGTWKSKQVYPKRGLCSRTEVAWYGLWSEKVEDESLLPCCPPSA